MLQYGTSPTYFAPSLVDMILFGEVKRPIALARVKRVLDLDHYYYMATDQVQCTTCGQKWLCTNKAILDQLSHGHRTQFPVIQTHK